MKAVRAIYQNGRVKLSEKPADRGPVEVLVVFPELGDDRWEAILREKTPRPAFVKFAKECLAEIGRGKATPLRLDQL